MFINEQALGSTVMSATGEVLGTIEEVVVHSESGRIAFAVMSFRFLDMPIMLFPVPWEAFSMGENNQLILDIPKEKLRHAPGYEKDDRPDFGSPQLGQKISNYYGINPFWEKDRDKSASFAFEEETFSVNQGNC